MFTKLLLRQKCLLALAVTLVLVVVLWSLKKEQAVLFISVNNLGDEPVDQVLFSGDGLEQHVVLLNIGAGNAEQLTLPLSAQGSLRFTVAQQGGRFDWLVTADVADLSMTHARLLIKGRGEASLQWQ